MDHQYSRIEIIERATFAKKDLKRIFACRRKYNQLGFAYQIAFVQLCNNFPAQQPFEIFDELLKFTGAQLDISSKEINKYTVRRETISEHQDQIRKHLKLKRFGDKDNLMLNKYLFEESLRLEQPSSLFAVAEAFLRERKILQPAKSTLERIVFNQRERTRQYIFKKITKSFSKEVQANLDGLLIVANKGKPSSFQVLKNTPGLPSPGSMQQLTDKTKQIKNTGVLDIDFSWLNNNYQLALYHYAKRSSADRLRALKGSRRYSVLTCFLLQIYKDTIDHIVDMHDKLISRIYKHAQRDIDEKMKKQRKNIRVSLSTLKIMGAIILNDSVKDSNLRTALFKTISKENLKAQIEGIEEWIDGKYSHVFHSVIKRFNYLRQFSPALLDALQLQQENKSSSSLIAAVNILKELNDDHKRKLPDDIPIDFISPKMRKTIAPDGNITKQAWESALVTGVRDEIKAGNISVLNSKRFGCFDDFFISDVRWSKIRKTFFRRSGLPHHKMKVRPYLKKRLGKAFDDFIKNQSSNTYATVNEKGWQLSTDPADKLDSEAEIKLGLLKTWLSEHLQNIKLPELLIKVDNDLHFTRHFMTSLHQNKRKIEDICIILATIMAHGCNIGPYTMSRLTEGISYHQIKHISDWQLTEESQRNALAEIVNAISNLDVTQIWGEGKTSSSDGQRFVLKKKVLQRTYSPRFSDFALEFYSFVADNYAPFYSTPIECTDRDAAYVLDGILYNESDLAIEEHYTDTHGYTEINFAAFAMLGRTFAPRIKGLHKQHIYRIDKTKDYDSLTSLVRRSDHTIHLDWIVDQWDRMGQFYASLESGHSTASTALKRLVSYNGKNHFYRANRELGRVFKTEHILKYMSDPLLRQRTRRGLLKGEQIHALARDVSYGKRGRINTRDLEEQKNSCSCLTLIMACIIYWQAKEINHVLKEYNPEKEGIDTSLVEHISPIGWDNVLLYGEYVLNRRLIKK
jgi:TnpA family transposase